MVTVPGAFGVGPGLYFDLARSVFHVPTQGSAGLVWAHELTAYNATHATARATSRLCTGPPWNAVLSLGIGAHHMRIWQSAATARPSDLQP